MPYAVVGVVVIAVVTVTFCVEKSETEVFWSPLFEFVEAIGTADREIGTGKASKLK